LQTDASFVLPTKTRDVYLYLPWRLMDILPTIALFSNLDLNTPETQKEHFFYSAVSVQDTGKTIELGNNISIIKDKNSVKLGDQEIPIKTFYQVGYDSTNTLKIDQQSIGSDGLTIIYLQTMDDFGYGYFYLNHPTYRCLYLNSTIKRAI
jgi:dolichyl-diphosphooligosaccharide--protein glycosyltransferase/undecaprenyl-diphosphooligosaccharide--protein glycosyltransferase